MVILRRLIIIHRWMKTTAVGALKTTSRRISTAPSPSPDDSIITFVKALHLMIYFFFFAIFRFWQHSLCCRLLLLKSPTVQQQPVRLCRRRRVHAVCCRLPLHNEQDGIREHERINRVNQQPPSAWTRQWWRRPRQWARLAHYTLMASRLAEPAETVRILLLPHLSPITDF